ncbi:MAG: glycine cleavage system aminomethyltransferase GcvT [Hyphomicrobiales bacterium]|nr:glycine cleavage system aminomethyltransferase GcvT [Hyphomicrobiales bacterium]
MSEARQKAPLLRTPLYKFHLERGARLVAFAGYEMPVQYPTGILTEHLHTRAAAGLFDISHMGQIAMRAMSGGLEDAARALETLVPADVIGIVEGRQRYALFTNAAGGILDDLMVANRGDHLLLIVNAACKPADLAHLRQHLGQTFKIDLLPDRALIALQGPLAQAALARLAPATATMRFMDVRTVRILGADCEVSRSGYTGEDGFEISIAADRVEVLARALCEDNSVMPIGLGARDSLRLEAGLCLYGSDLDPTTTPVMAALEWAIPRVRRAGGSRAGGFPGADVILRQLADGAPSRRVGLKVEDRVPVRGGAKLYADEISATPIGTVTSGSFGPGVQAPIAMSYVDKNSATSGKRIFGEVRGKRIALQVCDLPFVPHRYKRD